MSRYIVNADLVKYAYRDHYGGIRKEKVTGIIIHHAAAVWSCQQLLDFMAGGTRIVSSNFAIGNDGLLGLAVPETHRPYTTSGYWDESNITVEVCNSKAGGDWPVSDKALRKLIELVAYVCDKYNLEPTFTGGKDGTIRYHGMYEATACPGPYLKSKMKYIETEAKKLIVGIKPSVPVPDTSSDKLYRVQTGAFKQRANADKLESKLIKDGFATYMVVADGLYKIQVGAYANKVNADSMAKKLKAKGYDTYITTKAGQHAGAAKPKKTLAQLAAEVYKGDWGNGQARVDALKKAGYDPVAVQNEVNRRYY